MSNLGALGILGAGFIFVGFVLAMALVQKFWPAMVWITGYVLMGLDIYQHHHPLQAFLIFIIATFLLVVVGTEEFLERKLRKGESYAREEVEPGQADVELPEGTQDHS